MKKIVILTALLCLLIAFQSVLAAEPIRPEPKTGLTYDGTQQILIKEGTGIGGSPDETFLYWNESKGAWDDVEKPRKQYPGTYTVKFCLGSTESTPKSCKAAAETLTVTIAEVDQPHAKNESIKYDGSDQILIVGGEAKLNDVYYYRISSPSDQSTVWKTELPRATEIGQYTVEYILWPLKDADGEMTMPSTGVKGTPITVSILPRGSYNPSGNSGSGSSGSGSSGSGSSGSGSSGNSGSSSISFYSIGDGYGLFEGTMSLPATGFPTRFSKPLSIRPEYVVYEDLAMRIQIPSINVDVELTGVPVIGDTWAVEWLGNEAGMLSGSAMPGEGYTMVAAHNHLNTQEIGPFGFLFDLDENDRIFVNMPDGDLKIYSVYANELLEPTDFSQIASISENEKGSLILVTCENEMVDGGYQNRRVVFAKLMN